MATLFKIPVVEHPAATVGRRHRWFPTAAITGDVLERNLPRLRIERDA
jgi:hypothetical protein